MSAFSRRLPLRMRSILYCALILILSTVSVWGSGKSEQRPKFAPDQIIVKMKPGKAAELAAINRATGASVKRDLKAIGYTSLRIPPGLDVEKAIKRYRNHPAVEYAGPNHIFHTLTEPTGVVPNDPYFRTGYDVMYDILPGYVVTPPQWGLFNDGVNMMYMYGMPSPLYGIFGVDINASRAWEITTGCPDVIIAVIDTGIDFLHPDFVKSDGTSKIWRNPGETLNGQDSDGNGYIDDIHGWNFAYNNNDPTDDYSYEMDIRHGTWVSGIAGAATDNGIGIAGVSWESPIIPLKVVDAYDNATEDDIAAAIDYAVSNGAKIINMSIGLDTYPPAVHAAVDDAWARGAICVAAMGNSGDSTLYYPAAFSNSLSVGAINTYGIRCTADDWGSGGSTYNQYIDVSAPGNEILSFSSAWNPHTYMSLPGTSGAAPFVAGVAALVWAANPSWTNAQVVEQIKYTAIDITSDPAAGGQVLTGWDQYTGWGRVDAYRALTETVGFAESVSAAKLSTGDITARLLRKVVSTSSASIPGRLYVQEPDRSGGILLSFSGGVPAGFAEGDVVDLQGSVGKVQGEVAIMNPTIVLSHPAENLTVEPLGVTNKQMGGATFGRQAGVVDNYSLPRTFAKGLNNTSLLVKTWGKVTAVSSDWFYIDDGSNLEDHTGNSGVFVYCGTLIRPALNAYVSVTGISGCESLPPPNDHIHRRVLRPRTQEDIVVVKSKVN